MKDMIKMGLFLFVIASIAGALLAVTEKITAPRIAQNKKALLQKARKEVLPEAAKFQQHNLKLEDDKKSLSYSSGWTEENQKAGVVVNAYPKGYGGTIEMVVGIDNQGKIAGVKILSQKETPGLGTKLSDPVFMDPFKELIKEKKSPVFMVKQDGGDVDAITAATISSRAFCKGIRDSLAKFNLIAPQLESLSPPEPSTASATGGVK
ncbi:MAG: RnfABCDGE type electron transport complex subunit G [Candidatus Rifleibacteriota bacterium]